MDLICITFDIAINTALNCFVLALCYLSVTWISTTAYVHLLFMIDSFAGC